MKTIVLQLKMIVGPRSTCSPPFLPYRVFFWVFSLACLCVLSPSLHRYSLSSLRSFCSVLIYKPSRAALSRCTQTRYYLLWILQLVIYYVCELVWAFLRCVDIDLFTHVHCGDFASLGGKVVTACQSFHIKARITWSR